MINESDCSRDFSKEITKKYPDIHITIRNCNEFYNSLDFAKVSSSLAQHLDWGSYCHVAWFFALPSLLRCSIQLAV